MSRSRICARLNGSLALLLAALLGVQVAAAFLPATAVAAGAGPGLTLVICSDGGTETITLSEAGAAGGAPGQDHHAGHCPLCLVPASMPAVTAGDPAGQRLAMRLRYRFPCGAQTRGRPGRHLDSIRGPPQTV